MKIKNICVMCIMWTHHRQIGKMRERRWGRKRETVIFIDWCFPLESIRHIWYTHAVRERFPTSSHKEKEERESHVFLKVKLKIKPHISFLIRPSFFYYFVNFLVRKNSQVHQIAPNKFSSYQSQPTWPGLSLQAMNPAQVKPNVRAHLFVWVGSASAMEYGSNAAQYFCIVAHSGLNM